MIPRMLLLVILICDVAVLYQSLRELINQIWALEHFGNEKLSKYMRCLLKVTLPMQSEISLGLIGEISRMVTELAGVGHRCERENHFAWLADTTDSTRRISHR